MQAYIAFILLFAFYGIALSQDYMAELTKVATVCIGEAKADMKDIKNFVSGKITPEEAPENIKCALKCYLEKRGIITEAGEFNPKVYRAKVSPYRPGDEMAMVIQSCQDTKGNNPCDKAFKLSNCIAQS